MTTTLPLRAWLIVELDTDQKHIWVGKDPASYVQNMGWEKVQIQSIGTAEDYLKNERGYQRTYLGLKDK